MYIIYNINRIIHNITNYIMFLSAYIHFTGYYSYPYHVNVSAKVSAV